jgi:hypothetical protein
VDLDLGDPALGIRAQDLAPAAGDVADDVAHVLVGDVDVHGHDRLEEGVRPLLLRGLLEGQGAGNLEGHFRGVDVVVGAVEECHAEVDHRVAGDQAARGGLLDALVHRRDELARDDAAHDAVDELVPLATAPGLELDPAVAELATAAGLLLVPALDLRPALDRLAVGHLGRLEDHVDLVAALGLLDGYLDVQLAHAREEHVPGLLVAVEMQVDVLIEELEHCGEDLVLLALLGRRQGVGEQVRRQLPVWAQHELVLFVAQRVARGGVLELGHGEHGARAHALLAGICFLPSRRRIWPIFSLLSFLALSMVMSGVIVPERTRTTRAGRQRGRPGS